MRLVVIESPYAAPAPEGIERNLRYLRACLADCLRRGVSRGMVAGMKDAQKCDEHEIEFRELGGEWAVQS